jgi:hypothetical protein
LDWGGAGHDEDWRGASHNENWVVGERDGLGCLLEGCSTALTEEKKQQDDTYLVAICTPSLRETTGNIKKINGTEKNCGTVDVRHLQYQNTDLA